MVGGAMAAAAATAGAGGRACEWKRRPLEQISLNGRFCFNLFLHRLWLDKSYVILLSFLGFKIRVFLELQFLLLNFLFVPQFQELADVSIQSQYCGE